MAMLVFKSGHYEDVRLDNVLRTHVSLQVQQSTINERVYVVV